MDGIGCKQCNIGVLSHRKRHACSVGVTGSILPTGEGVNGATISRLEGIRAAVVNGNLALVDLNGVNNAVDNPGNLVGGLNLVPLSEQNQILGSVGHNAIGIGHTSAVSSRVPCAEGSVVLGEEVGVQLLAAGQLQNLVIHAAVAAIGIEGNIDLLNPLIMSCAVVESSAGLCAGGIQQSAVTVLQLNRCQRNEIVRSLTLVEHIAEHILTGTVIHHQHTGLLRGNDIGATADDGEILIGSISPGDSTVNKAISNNLTVDINGNVRQIRNSTGLAGGAGIGQRTELSGGMNEVHTGDSFQSVHIQCLQPVLTVENLEHMTTSSHNIAGFLSESKIQGSILANGQAGARQKHHVLLQGGGTGMQIDANVIGDRQHESAGVNSCTAQFQVHRGHNAITIGMHFQHICGRVIIFDEIRTGSRLEHCAGADELDGSAVAHIGHEDRGSNILGGAVLITGGDLDVLNVVLAQREHQELRSQLRSDGTTTEVHNLEVLVDAGTVLSGDGALAVDVAPAVQICAGVQLDVRAGKHVHKAQLFRGAAAVHAALAAGCCMTTANLNVTVDSNRGIGSQSQGAIGSGLNPGNIAVTVKVRAVAGAAGVGTMPGVIIIIRNQQSNAGRNGVISGNSAVIQQNDNLICTCNSSRCSIGQVVILHSADAEQRNGAGNEHRGDGSIHRSSQGIVGILGNKDTLLILPTVELIARGRGSHQSQARTGGNRHLGFCGHSGPVDGIATIYRSHKGQIRVSSRGAD